jgi:hypothetical protein
VSSATIDELTVADEPEAWLQLGFDVASGCCMLGSVRLRLLGAAAGRRIVGWSLRDLASSDLDGLPTTRSERAAGEPAGAHPNGVLAIDHIVAVSPALDRSVPALQAAGLDLRRIREEPTPAGAPRQAFFRLGEVILEVIQEPEHVAGPDAGPDRPAFFWGLALLSDDLDATAAAMAPHVGSIRPAVQQGRRIATVKRSAGLGLPLALISGRERGEEQ